MNYVRVFCEVYPEICRSFEQNICPVCGYRARNRKVLWLHLYMHSPECMTAVNHYIRRYAEMYSLATTRYAYYRNYDRRIKFYKCTICGYRARTKFDIAKHIMLEHLPLLEKQIPF